MQHIRSMTRALLALVVSTQTGIGLAEDQIGPWTVRSPDSTELVHMGQNYGWYSISRAPGLLTIDEAFSAPTAIDDAGYANGGAGTTLQMHFNAPIVNLAGPDIVVFDAFFELNSYEVRVGNDGFSAWIAVSAAQLLPTGVAHDYYYGPWPVECNNIAVHAVGVDLAALGIPAGGSVSDVQLVLTALGSDPLGIGAVVSSNPPCPADLNADGAVNLGDLTQLLSNFGMMQSANPDQGDLDNDDDVDLADLSGLLANFGVICH